MTQYYLSGIANWAKVQTPVPTFDKKGTEYTIDITLDEKSLNLFRESGCQVNSVAERKRKKGKTVESSDEERTYTFRCPTEKLIKGEKRNLKPIVLDNDNNPLGDNVGNGSMVTAKVDIYPTRMGVGHTLAAVRVDDLVPFENSVRGEIESPF